VTKRSCRCNAFFSCALNNTFITLSGDQESRLKKAVVVIDTLAAANKIGFTTQDFVQIYNHGIPFDNIVEQLGFFKMVFPKQN
jgi:fatty acid-binding protein DegV